MCDFATFKITLNFDFFKRSLVWLAVLPGNSTFIVGCKVYMLTVIYTHRRNTEAAHHGDLPQRLSVGSWPPRVVFAMPPIDATGGQQVTAGRSGPWWCCDYCCCCCTITSRPPQRRWEYTNSTGVRSCERTNMSNHLNDEERRQENINTTSSALAPVLTPTHCLYQRFLKSNWIKFNMQETHSMATAGRKHSLRVQQILRTSTFYKFIRYR